MFPRCSVGAWRESGVDLKLLESRLTRRVNKLPAAVLSVPAVENLLRDK